MARSAKDVQAFFERVATDWDTMRLAYYDERVIEKMAEVAGIAEGADYRTRLARERTCPKGSGRELDRRVAAAALLRFVCENAVCWKLDFREDLSSRELGE
jgi:hypothetical protein